MFTPLVWHRYCSLYLIVNNVSLVCVWVCVCKRLSCSPETHWHTGTRSTCTGWAPTPTRHDRWTQSGPSASLPVCATCYINNFQQALLCMHTQRKTFWTYTCTAQVQCNRYQYINRYEHAKRFREFNIIFFFLKTLNTDRSQAWNVESSHYKQPPPHFQRCRVKPVRCESGLTLNLSWGSDRPESKQIPGYKPGSKTRYLWNSSPALPSCCRGWWDSPRTVPPKGTQKK